MNSINTEHKLTTLEARNTIAKGIESEIRALQKTNFWHHILYFIFPFMAVVGVTGLN